MPLQSQFSHTTQPVEEARVGNVLHHLRGGESDAVLEGLGGAHGGVPLGLQVQEEGTARGLGAGHPGHHGLVTANKEDKQQLT